MTPFTKQEPKHLAVQGTRHLHGVVATVPIWIVAPDKNSSQQEPSAARPLPAGAALQFNELLKYGGVALFL
jgi:hypothetical protein